MFKQRGFTLIELLIVIAIILILIAIALPNFLEAQIRAKVTKAQGEMRTLGTAIEAYYTDYNQYPADGDDLDPTLFPFDPANFDSFTRMKVLTTPIAYLTEIPFDPFHGETVDLSQTSAAVLFLTGPPFTYAYNTFGSYGAQSPGTPDNFGRPDDWGVTSLGPNGLFDADINGPVYYSATNGTKSVGDIIRKGGRRTILDSL
ncbi:MAG: prepilin-type N-terminal cleavage/methylation domain-containing protein [Candidatus Omnitrophica bacterium]|nr:prepilin-type N-terminal cleavage/methylation domain-containing protein [Candidatus Omnitrophota bacterium]MCA9415211.1 prepilin-type N-terminal cleavage/methylation domain-containing protein [Candidatus Omnitrophota bacterium]MCA9424426.1 prepilin-type N-terminal cleavage/methylation domain-containing protein [Candidatus Omnitrophota bacterium]MCA9429038.1 prepilin-type N-terminal cleavage/methylation domain-containing protein [Candidatus Omnitrophota bacterium]MCA9435811.1 prepilin-type N-